MRNEPLILPLLLSADTIGRVGGVSGAFVFSACGYGKVAVSWSRVANLRGRVLKR